jgi:hypothetical protein
MKRFRVLWMTALLVISSGAYAQCLTCNWYGPPRNQTLCGPTTQAFRCSGVCCYSPPLTPCDQADPLDFCDDGLVMSERGSVRYFSEGNFRAVQAASVGTRIGYSLKEAPRKPCKSPTRSLG